MAKIVRSQRDADAAAPAGVGAPAAPIARPVTPRENVKRSRQVFVVCWVVFMLFWPITRWILAFDVLFQSLRAMYHWDTPGVYAGWSFMLHLVVASVLNYLVVTVSVD